MKELINALKECGFKSVKDGLCLFRESEDGLICSRTFNNGIYTIYVFKDNTQIAQMALNLKSDAEMPDYQDLEHFIEENWPTIMLADCNLCKHNGECKGMICKGYKAADDPVPEEHGCSDCPLALVCRI